jgi:glycerol-3-phosphate dehydrogenase subunit C
MLPPSLRPSEGSTTDPEHPAYWRARPLGEEVARVFDVCAGCRMCFKYCDSFARLFDIADRRHDGDARALVDGEIAQVMDACFQCKLCEVTCPYTPREKHAFAIDFPKLVLRWRAQRARTRRPSLRDRLLADPDRLARLARLAPSLANRLARSRPARALLHGTMGIHRDAPLPRFAPRRFEAWADREGLCREHPGGEAVLFPTCVVENNQPEIGRDAVEVMKRNAVDVRCAHGLACCGMPAWEGGDLQSLRDKARRNLDQLLPFVDAGARVVVLGPTCAMMLRREYPDLVAEADRPRARKLAAAVREATELLWERRDQPGFDRNFAALPRSVAYHAPCHVRAQMAGLRGRDLLRAIGVERVQLVAECCGHDGSHGIKRETFEAAERAGRRAFDGLRAADAAGGTTWVSDCPLAAQQIEKHAGKRPLHPMSLLARAYRGEG